MLRRAIDDITAGAASGAWTQGAGGVLEAGWAEHAAPILAPYAALIVLLALCDGLCRFTSRLQINQV